MEPYGEQTNRRVANIEGRRHLSCDRCPPHRGENRRATSRKRNHGQKPKARTRRGV